MSKKFSFRLKTSYLILINAALLLCIALLFVFFDSDYQNKLREQNLMDIANINQSSANIADIFFQNQQARLSAIEKYISLNHLDLNEALTFISQSNAEEGTFYELIASDKRGFVITGKEDDDFQSLDYSNNTYQSMWKTVDESGEKDDKPAISFTPIFTDQFTAKKSFALFTKLFLTDEQGEQCEYTLLSVKKIVDIIATINVESGYQGMSTVLVDNTGKYIVNSPEFRSNDFFQFIHDYNDMTLDQKNEFQKEFFRYDSGNLFYQNSRGQECVYRYSRITNSDRYAITCVPLDSFHNNEFDFRFTILIAGIFLLLMAVNILWLLRTNQSLKLSAAREREASEAKTDFLSRMSHDIRTPLNGIIGLTDLAIRENNPPVTADYLNKITYSGNFLLGLVNDILDMNKVESGKMELRPVPYNYQEFEKNIKSVVLPLCDTKGLNFSMKNDSGLDQRYFMIDKLRFNQIIVNLLSNAVKFTPEDGEIELTFYQHLISNNAMILDLQVRDNGIGMSAEFQKRMFDTFSQEHKSEESGQSGSGLGLAIVKNLVSLMDGTLTVVSEEGKGSVFSIHLEVPLADEKATANRKQYNDEMLTGKRILVCEDNKINALVIKKVLETKSILYDHVENGRLAVEMFQNSVPGYYDAILMDIRMPVMDGLEATRAIRSCEHEDAARIPIIAMTANAFEQDVQDAIDAGMNAHLSKPVDSSLLFRTLCENMNSLEG